MFRLFAAEETYNHQGNFSAGNTQTCPELLMRQKLEEHEHEECFVLRQRTWQTKHKSLISYFW
jgi:hypothetical protein